MHGHYPWDTTPYQTYYTRENYVGNGPFRLDAWQPGELMAFSRNPSYRGRFRGNVQRVELLPILEELEDPASD